MAALKHHQRALPAALASNDATLSPAAASHRALALADTHGIDALVTRADTQALLGIKRTRFWELAAANEIQVVRTGARSRHVTLSSIAAYIERCKEAA